MKFELDFKNITLKKFPRKGNMINNYVPFLNLINITNGNTDGGYVIKEFNTTNLGYSHQLPLHIDILNYPDGSINLIINDAKNKPKLINSRFSTAENNTFIIPDHFGNKDTSLYDNSNLDLDASLYKNISKLPEIEFIGLETDGYFPCGAYHFYFKLSDNDGNESDFVGESSTVVCHIGKINDPFSIRMGMENENSEKRVLFKLTNLDLTYDYVDVYYSRTTSGEDGSDLTTYHQVLERFPINNGVCNLQLHGKEPSKLITDKDINIAFYYCDYAKTQAICQNRLFLGNVLDLYIDYALLKNLSLYITPKPSTKEIFNNVNFLYKNTGLNNGYGYYNVKNIYYRTGYWPEEYYRFGIVYILDNYSLSSVFNIRGITNGDFTQEILTNKDPNGDWIIPTIHYNDDGFILNGSTLNINQNVHGVTWVGKETELHSLLGIEFTIPNAVKESLLKLGIKGYFFVRQQRKPIILGQGVAIGKTTNNFGNVPVIKDYALNSYFSESFLKQKTNSLGEYLILERDLIKVDENNVEIKACVIPEAVVREPLYNQIFLGQNFHYEVIANELNNEGLSKTNRYRYFTNSKQVPKRKSGVTTFLNIPSGVKVKTNGEEYYCSLAGVAEDVSTFISVLHDWKHEGNTNVVANLSASKAFVSNDLSKCIPFELKLDLVVRGVFGAYVGLGKLKEGEELSFGDIINIRPESYNPDDEDWQKQQVILRSYDHSKYSAISDRKEFTSENLDITELCFRGDSYICPFTHRMLRNHIDPELPTNDNIVDNLAWDNNFLVITKSKITDEESPTGYRYINEVVPLFKARNKWYIDESGNAVNLMGAAAGAMFGSLFTMGLAAGAIAKDSVWEKDILELQWGDGSNVAILLPNDSKFAKAGGIGETFGMPNTWYEYGTKNISRSDINSVGLGHWLTVFVRSNINLCLRDIDKYQISEKVIFNKERGFYPLYPISLSSEYKLPESKIINGACNVSLSKKAHMELANSPYIKQQYDTRVIYSNTYNGGFKNGFRVFMNHHYHDLPKTYGALVRLIEYGGDLLAIMEHGIMLVPVNERTVGAAGSGGMAYINTPIVLPENPNPVSADIGSLWPHSIIKTDQNYVYGVDTSTKKIWRYKASKFECISDFKLLRFLNDNINLKEWDTDCEIGFKEVRTHYNNFKKDVIFVFYNDHKLWSLCFNENTNTFTTFYSWAPSLSENINTTFITLDLEDSKNNINTYSNFERTNLYKTYKKLGIDLKWIDSFGLEVPLDTSEYIEYTIDNNTLDSPTLTLYVLKSKCVSSSKNNVSNPFYFKDSKDQNLLKYQVLSLYDPLFHEDNKFFNVEIEEMDEGKILVYYVSIKDTPELIEELKNKKYITCKIQLEYWDLVLNKLGLEEELLVTDYVTFRINNSDKSLENLLWKHGLGGIYDGQHEILPTNWYNKLEPFEFEFVVQLTGWLQFLYHNLLIASNNAKPEEIQFEVVGDSYDWWRYKDVINFVNKISANEEELYNNYVNLLSYTLEELDTIIWPNMNYPKLSDKNGSYKYTIKTIPYITHVRRNSLGNEYNKFSNNTTNVQLVYDDLLPEKHIRSTLLCNDIKLVGRIQGNIEYKEDVWVTDIRHINFKLAYTKDKQSLCFKPQNYAKLRDKYVKIKIKYSGKDLALIRGVLTLLEASQS